MSYKIYGVLASDGRYQQDVDGPSHQHSSEGEDSHFGIYIELLSKD